MKRVLIIAGMLLLPSLASAQESRRPMQLNTIEWILSRKDEFRPSAEQVAKLEEAAGKLNETTAAMREEIRKSRDEGMSGDRREAFQKMRPLMEKLRKQDQEATREALKVLNDEQRKVVDDMLAERRKQMEERRPRMRG